MKTCLVNLAYLDPAHVGGVGRIAYEVSRLVVDCALTSPDMRVVFVVNRRFVDDFAGWLGQTAVVVPFISKYDLKLTLRLLKPDVIVSPLFGLEPFTQAAGTHIVGMPDALALDHPELFSADDLAYRQGVYAHLKQAFRVVTLSEHAKERLLHHTGLTPEQVVVVGLGADAQTTPQAAAIPDLPKRYLYYPANLWPHKRHDLLLQIMNRVWEREPDLHLVLTGGRSEEDQQRLKALITRLDCPPERIHDLGYVNDAQLITLYQKAEALLFVSQYEGFGMPLLEAMQQGCPVICASVSAIPEVAGDAAIMVNSNEAADWAEAILTTLPAKRAQLIDAGRKRAAAFTWSRTHEGWTEVLVRAGIVCQNRPILTDQNLAKMSIAVWMLPLLKRVSDLSAPSGRSRWRRLAVLPLLVLLQIQLLSRARRYISAG